jgi:hypothetical protein
LPVLPPCEVEGFEESTAEEPIDFFGPSRAWQQYYTKHSVPMELIWVSTWVQRPERVFPSIYIAIRIALDGGYEFHPHRWRNESITRRIAISFGNFARICLNNWHLVLADGRAKEP